MQTYENVDPSYMTRLMLLQTVMELREQVKWLPIDQAPREAGQLILGYREVGDAFWLLSWNNVKQGWFISGTITSPNPTHFQYLTAPTKKAEA